MTDDSADLGSGGSSGGSAHSSREKAFEIFVKRTITSIQKEAWGRSKEVKEIREACQAFLNKLEQTGCTEETVKEVLKPLELACSSNMQKVVELALGCLHKLVAHAWLHGESTPSGTMDMLSATGSVDGDDTVAQVVKMVIKCGETPHESLQLAVVRALLTFTTAEHFITHGECLLAAVRAVFNLALNSENPINKRTASNALLQMLNTIAKRVTQIQPRNTGSECSFTSRTASDAFELGRSSSIATHYAGHSPKDTRHPLGGPSFLSLSSGNLHGMSGSLHGSNAAALAVQASIMDPLSPAEADDGRLVQLAALAEQQNIRGLEAALQAAAPPADDGGDDDGGPYDSELVSQSSISTINTPMAAAGLQRDGSGDGSLEASSGLVCAAASGSYGQMAAASRTQQTLSAAAVARVAARGRVNQRLSTPEKDVLLVLTAFCKLASRETGSSSSEGLLNQGKLLALEMLAKVLCNPLHAWDHVREPFCKQLRQPLCLALLRNCANNDPVAFALAARLLASILALPRLRLGLRAELGAFYPLLILRLLEQPVPEHANLVASLAVLFDLLADPQLLVDIFVNYDCDLQASNLYERTVQVRRGCASGD